MALYRDKQGNKLYPVCSWEKNQHKLYNALDRAHNELYDAIGEHDLDRIERAENEMERIEGALTAFDRFVVEGINKAFAEDGKSYDWEKYYGSYWSKRANRKEISFKPKQEYVNEIGKILLDIAKDPEIKLETCSFTIPGLKASACLDPLIIERITGIDVTSPNGTYNRDTSRPECMCYGCHGDFFKRDEKKCYSSCAYCYAGHSSDSNFKYYNEDGTIIDRPISRVQMDNVQMGNTSEADVLSQMRKAGEQVRKDCKGE